MVGYRQSRTRTLGTGDHGRWAYVPNSTGTCAKREQQKVPGVNALAQRSQVSRVGPALANNVEGHGHGWKHINKEQFIPHPSLLFDPWSEQMSATKSLTTLGRQDSPLHLEVIRSDYLRPAVGVSQRPFSRFPAGAARAYLYWVPQVHTLESVNRRSSTRVGLVHESPAGLRVLSTRAQVIVATDCHFHLPSMAVAKVVDVRVRVSE